MGKKLNLIGLTFGQLLVLEEVAERHKTTREVLWLCQCTCGESKKISGQNLKKGKTSSCGCTSNKEKRKGTEVAYTSLINIYKRNSRNRNLDFLLSREEFINLILDNCFYCGSVPKNKHNPYLRKDGSFNRYHKSLNKYAHDESYEKSLTTVYNGIDRFNNIIGYTKENSVSCCTICNRAKRELSYEEFKLWIQQLLNFQKK